jgi:hypothetical protein
VATTSWDIALAGRTARRLGRSPPRPTATSSTRRSIAALWLDDVISVAELTMPALMTRKVGHRHDAAWSQLADRSHQHLRPLTRPTEQAPANYRA